jgi:hypothetical protein
MRDNWPLVLFAVLIVVLIGGFAWAMVYVHDYAPTTVLSTHYEGARSSTGYAFGSGNNSGGVVVTSSPESFVAIVRSSGGVETVNVPKTMFHELKAGSRVCVDWSWQKVVPMNRCAKKERP